MNAASKTEPRRFRLSWPRFDDGVAADLLLVFLAALGVRLMWAAIVPPWLSPDEPQHFAYVAHLVENGEIPNPVVSDTRYPVHSPEWEHSCAMTLCSRLSGLGAGLGGLRYLPIDYDYAKARAHTLGLEQRKTASGSSASTYSPFYYSIASLPYRLFHSAPILTRMLGIRAASSLLSGLACVFGYLFVYEIRRRREWGRALGLCLAFMPMYAFIGASVNNDAAMFATSAALCWLTAKYWLSDELPSIAALSLGLVAGLLVLSKQTGAPLVAPVTLLVLAKSIKSTRGTACILRSLTNIGLFSVGLTLTEGMWLAYRLIHAKALPSTGDRPAGLLQIIQGQAPHSFSDYLSNLHARSWSYVDWLFGRSAWGIFGWLEIYLPDLAYTAVNAAVGLAALGLFVRCLKYRNERPLTMALLSTIVWNIVMLFLAADYVMAFAIRGGTFGMQGRYFFGTLVPCMYLLLSGWSVFFRDRPVALRLLPLAVVLLNLASISTLLRSYYGLEVR